MPFANDNAANYHKSDELRYNAVLKIAEKLKVSRWKSQVFRKNKLSKRVVLQVPFHSDKRIMKHGHEGDDSSSKG